MIKNIFIPTKIGSYYLFEETVVGIEFNKNNILASVISAKGSKRTIVQVLNESIDAEEPNIPYEQQAAKALIRLKNRLNKFDKLYVSLPTSYAIFKDLQLPFLGISKAKMVAPFEIEQYLPFNINQALIDSLIIDQDKKDKKTYLITVAVKRETIDKYLNIFKEANLAVDKITLDILELYGLFKSLKLNKNKVTALINLNLTNTTIAILIEDNLFYVRNLPQGIANSTKNQTNQNGEFIDNLLRFGLNENIDIFQNLISQIKFTINTILNLGIPGSENINLNEINAVITGFGSEIQGMPELICKILETKCYILNIREIVKNGIHSKINDIPNKYLLSISTALPDKITNDFNLMPENTKSNSLTVNQILTLFILSILTLGTFLTYSFIKVNKIKNLTNKLEQEANKQLRKDFTIKRAKNLKTTNTEAQKELRARQETASQLLDKNSYSFLNYLDELNRVIDRKRIDLKIDKMTILPEQIAIQGSVKDIEAAKIFESQIEQSPVFSIKSSLQTPDFTRNPLIIEISNKIHKQGEY